MLTLEGLAVLVVLCFVASLVLTIRKVIRKEP
jgi:hypothetical protein